MFQSRPTVPLLQMGIFGFSLEETGDKSLPWQQHRRRHSDSFVTYISGAKFEEHCSNISGDFLIRCFNDQVERFMTSSLFSFA